MSLRDFFKEHYILEVTRRHELTNALAIPFGVVSLLLGAQVVMAREIHMPLDEWKIFQLMTLFASFIAIAATTYFLFRSYYNYTYGYVPTPLEIKLHRNKLVDYYVSNGKSHDEAMSIAEAETYEHIDSEYATHTHRNTANNDLKSFFIHRANGALIFSIVFTVAAGMPYLARSIASPTEVQKFEIINFKEAVMNNSSNEQKQTTQKQNTPPPVVEKPSPPPGRLIRENVEPKLKK